MIATEPESSPTNSRARLIAEYFDRLAPQLDAWRQRNRYYHHDQEKYLTYLISPGQRVLELGCGTGELLSAVRPSHGVGIDISPAVVDLARQRHPQFQFFVDNAEGLDSVSPQQFDYIILSDLVGYLDDIQKCLDGLHRFCGPETRIVISAYNFLWQPILAAGEALRLKMPAPEQSWLSLDDLRNLLYLCDFQVVKTERRLLFPKFVPLLSWLLNHLGHMPGINTACLSQYVVARPGNRSAPQPLSVSVIVPCRNERGNVEPAIRRLPRFGTHLEVIFVDGHSTDGTPDEIRRVIAACPDYDIKFVEQRGTGKADAVRMGFEVASGDILMILDADLTVPPEDLPRFYRAIATGKGEFLNGCRLVYPLEDEAMRSLNLLGNKFFAMAFSWLLGQRLKDTLCGTKVIRRDAYHKLVATRKYFGEFDPFGDFDLLFGASKLNLKIAEVPVRYHRRLYGETKIHRFRHGLILLRMVVYAYRKLKSL